jgi:ribosome-binding factor A
VAEFIRQELAGLIRKLSDPRVGFVTVTRVEVSPDLSVAKVFISVMDGAGKEELTLAALKGARRHLQIALSDLLDLRRCPALVFAVDRGVKHSIRMNALLHDLARERGETPPLDAAAEVPAPDPSQEDGERHDQ